MPRWPLGLILWLPILAGAKTHSTPDLADFVQQCRTHRAAHASLQLDGAPPIGAVSFLPTWILQASQTRFSWATVRKKLAKDLASASHTYDSKNVGQWVLPFNNGQALYGTKQFIRGIYYRGQVYIVDGHHRGLLSTYIAAETVPVKIVDDLSALAPAQLFEFMDAQGLAKFRNFRGQSVNPVDLCDLQNDPNLNLARALLARVDVLRDGANIQLQNLRGKKRVIGIKTGGDLSFLEFEVGDALRRAGVEWSDDADSDIPKDVLKSYLTILQTAAQRPNSRLKKVFLFDKPRLVADLRLDEAALIEHVRSIDCEQALRNAK